MKGTFKPLQQLWTRSGVAEGWLCQQDKHGQGVILVLETCIVDLQSRLARLLCTADWVKL